MIRKERYYTRESCERAIELFESLGYFLVDSYIDSDYDCIEGITVDCFVLVFDDNK